jgi:DNA-binding transcriptional LysR family regulator
LIIRTNLFYGIPYYYVAIYQRVTQSSKDHSAVRFGHTMAEKKLLPSMSMLASFDATARSGSFSAAARELSLTHGAVSRQVSALEFQLGTQLFVRSTRGIQLTTVGKLYAGDVHSTLSALRDATLEVITKPKSSVIDLAILPTFGTRWLIPRFPGFVQRYPDISVNFVTRFSQFEFDETGIDAAIHFGAPNWPGADCTFLMGERAVPACSPALLKSAAYTAENDFRALPLLHLESRQDAWKDWFRSQNFDAPVRSDGMVFEQISLVAHAASAGLGVALLPRFLIQGEISRGELTVLSDRASASELSYYLVTPASKTHHAPIAALREWLLHVIETERLDSLQIPSPQCER